MMFSKEQLQRFSIRKLTVGAASVLIGVSLMTEMNNNKVYADVRTTNENSNSQVHDNSDGNTLNLSTDLKSKADEAGTADSKVTNNSNAKVGGDGVTDNSNARNVEIKNIDDSKKDQQSGDAVAPKEKTANTIRKHEENVAKGTTVDSIDLQVTKAQADLAATKINGKASSVVSPQIKQIQAKYQTSKNPPLEKQINPTDRNSDGKVVVKAEDPSNYHYPRDLNNLIGTDKYIYQVLSLNNYGSQYPDSKLILSVNRNDSDDKNIYAYVDNNGEIEPVIKVEVNQNKIIDINGRGYQINNDGSSNIIIDGNKESTQNSSTVTSAPGYWEYDSWDHYYYYPYSNVNPIEQGYGLGSTTSNDYSAIGEIIPIHTESSVIKYYYCDDNGDLQEFKDSDLSLHPNVVVTGLTGQEFKIPNVDQYKQVIPGFYLTSKDIPTNFTGTLSQFEEGKYYKKAYYNYDTDNVKYYSVYHQVSPDGKMAVGVFDKNGYQITVYDENGYKRPELIEIGADHYTTFKFQIQDQDQTQFLTVRNPYVAAAPHEVQFIYKKLGFIIPVDENGKQIGDAIQFENDPKDPTQASGKVPSISGYTPLDKAVGDPVVPKDPGENIKVVYTANAQTATITYIDDATKTNLNSKKAKGKFDQAITFETAPTDEIANYEKQGYKLVSNDFNNNKYQADDSNNVFYVHFIHDTKNVNRNNSVNMTVHYVMDDGSEAPSDNKQTLSFTEDGTQDLVTKDITWTPADSQTFKDVATKSIAGYTPDKDNVAGQTVNFGDKDIEVTVRYSPNVQLGHINYIDDSTKKTLTRDDFSGRTNEHEDYTPIDRIQEFENKGYELVSNDYPDGGFNFDDNDQQDQVFNVHLKHGTVTVTTKKPQTPNTPINPDPQSPKYPKDISNTNSDVKRTIDYKHSDGKTAQPTVNDSLHFERTVVIDKVTGDVLSDTWTQSQDFNDVQTPVIQGYTPDRTVVSDKNIGHDHQNIVEHVVYSPDAQHMTITYIDDTTGKTLHTDKPDGVSDQDTKYTTSDTIKQYEDQHYKLVSDSTKGQDLIFDHDDKVNQTYEVHFVHGMHTISQTTSPKQTIHYVYADGLARQGKVTDDNVQQLSFKRDGYNDEVTGTDHWNAWTPANSNYNAVDSPEIQGYTPDKSVIEKSTVNPTDKDTEITVTYNADKQAAHVIYIDKTTNTTLASNDLSGKSDKDSGYNTQKQIGDYQNKHYVLTSDETNEKNVVFDHNDNDQTYHVYFVHGTQDVNHQDDVTETVDYKFENGETAQPTVTQTKHFSEGGVKDLVTGKIA